MVSHELLFQDMTHTNLPIHEDVEDIVAPFVRKEPEVVVGCFTLLEIFFNFCLKFCLKTLKEIR